MSGGRENGRCMRSNRGRAPPRGPFHRIGRALYSWVSVSAYPRHLRESHSRLRLLVLSGPVTTNGASMSTGALAAGSSGTMRDPKFDEEVIHLRGTRRTPTGKMVNRPLASILSLRKLFQSGMCNAENASFIWRPNTFREIKR